MEKMGLQPKQHCFDYPGVKKDVVWLGCLQCCTVSHPGRPPILDGNLDMVDFHIFVQVHVNYAEFFFLNRILTDLDSVATSHCWILGLYDYIMHLAVFFSESLPTVSPFFSLERPCFPDGKRWHL